MKKSIRLICYSIIAVAVVVCCAAALKPEIFKGEQNAETVNAETTDAITAFKTERQQLRSMQIASLDSIVDDDSLSQNMRDEASGEKIAVMKRDETEQTLARILAARGFTDCAVSVGEGTVTIMVRTDSLAKEDVAAITLLAEEECGVSARNIRIITIK